MNTFKQVGNTIMANDAQDIQLLSLNEVCKILRVSRPVAQKLITDGKLKATRVGRQQRIARKDLEKFLKNN